MTWHDMAISSPRVSLPQLPLGLGCRYFLELIFLIENVFVFHAIAEAVLVPAKRVVSCLVLVAWGQMPVCR